MTKALPKTVLLATQNAAKVERYKKELSQSGVTLLSLADLLLTLPEPEENGASERENAEIKARAYHEAAALPALANDTGLYIAGLREAEQPGRFTLRAAAVLPGDRPEDRFWKMAKHYTGIAERSGGEVEAYFLDAYCLVTDGRALHVEAKRPIVITTTLHERKDPAFPLCSFYKARSCGKPYYDMTAEEMGAFLGPSSEAARALLREL